MEVALNEGGSETVTFDNIIIATGSSTRLVPGTSLSDNVVTYEELILSRELPSSIVIAGAGAIGMEFGYVLKNYGVDVTVVEFLPRALPKRNTEVSKEIEKQFKKLGVKVLTGTKVESILDEGANGTFGSPSARTASPTRSRPRRCCRPSASRRTSRVTGLTRPGCSSPSARPSASTTTCAPTCRTSTLSATSPACCNSRTSPRRRGLWRPNSSGAQRLCRSGTTGCCRARRSAASFGLTEEQARDEGYDVKVAKFPFTANAKAHGVGDPSGFVKLIADGKYGELLGGHLIGHDVSELLPPS